MRMQLHTQLIKRPSNAICDQMHACSIKRHNCSKHPLNLKFPRNLSNLLSDLPAVDRVNLSTQPLLANPLSDMFALH